MILGLHLCSCFQMLQLYVWICSPMFRLYLFFYFSGGVYSGEMRVQECTHLIINEPRGKTAFMLIVSQLSASAKLKDL